MDKNIDYFLFLKKTYTNILSYLNEIINYNYMSEVKYDTLLCCKIAVIGSCAVGKTAIINRLINNYFPIRVKNNFS